MNICSYVNMKVIVMNSKKTVYNNEEDICKVRIIHEDSIEHVKNEMIDEKTVMELSEIFKIFGDPTRIRIISLLTIEELCVCDLSEILGMSQSAVSHQLRTLRGKNLVKFRKEGKQAYYSLADKHVLEILNIGVNHVHE